MTVIHGHSRFWRKVVTGDGCWVWQGYIDPEGYGRIWWKDRVQLAHVVSYKIAFGPVPDGHVIDHTCEHPYCVNPMHLEAVTNGVNLIRSATTEAGKNVRKTHCKRGHEFTEENTYVRPNTTYRECRTCKRNIHNKRLT